MGKHHPRGYYVSLANDLLKKTNLLVKDYGEVARIRMAVYRIGKRLSAKRRSMALDGETGWRIWIKK